jgi:hypothetical protein
MDVILNHYPILQTGTFEIRRTVTVAVSAESARRQVHRWLLLEVSHMMGADEPTLVAGDRACWRVPVHLSAPQVGLVGQVGEIDVDAITGEMMSVAAQKVTIEQRARELMHKLPPFRTQSTIPDAYLPRPGQHAPQLILNDADEAIVTTSQRN